MKSKSKVENIYIEEPVYSWGRRNPKVFAKSVALITLVKYLLHVTLDGIKVYSVNNKEAKRASGYGGNNKGGMIEAYRKYTGALPGHKTQYGKETLADSFFIAIAGYNHGRREFGRKA